MTLSVKVGTKHSAIVTQPLKDLSVFGVSVILSETELYLTEQYLVRVWVGTKRKRTSISFDELRVELHQISVIALSVTTNVKCYTGTFANGLL